MKRLPQGNIKNPCSVFWDSMEKTTNPNVKFCQSCKKKVFDITDFEAKEILDLYQKSAGNLCVRMPSNHNKRNISHNFKMSNSLWKKGKQIGLVVLGLFIGKSVYSQKEQLSSYEIHQIETVSNTIVISGNIKGKKNFGWRKLKNAFIFIYAEDMKTVIGSCQSDAKGHFILELNKNKIGENLTVTINYSGYSTLTIPGITTKNTNLQVLLNQKQSDYFVTGRYF